MEVSALKLKLVLLSEHNVIWLVYSYWLQKNEEGKIIEWGYELENQCEAVQYVKFPHEYVHNHMEIVGEL